MLWLRIRQWGMSYLLMMSKRKRKMSRKRRSREKMMRKMYTPFSLYFLVPLKSAKRSDQSSTKQFRRSNSPKKFSPSSKIQPPASS